MTEKLYKLVFILFAISVINLRAVQKVNAAVSNSCTKQYILK